MICNFLCEVAFTCALVLNHLKECSGTFILIERGYLALQSFFERGCRARNASFSNTSFVAVNISCSSVELFTNTVRQGDAFSVFARSSRSDLRFPGTDGITVSYYNHMICNSCPNCIRPQQNLYIRREVYTVNGGRQCAPKSFKLLLIAFEDYVPRYRREEKRLRNSLH